MKGEKMDVIFWSSIALVMIGLLFIVVGSFLKTEKRTKLKLQDMGFLLALFGSIILLFYLVLQIVMDLNYL